MPNDLRYGETDILYPITVDEARWLKKTISTCSAPGPDDLLSKDFKRIPDSDLQHLYNFKLERACSTKDWQEARTVLIPKSDTPESPTEFRQIMITSTLTGGLYKILAKRLADSVHTDAMQRGFMIVKSLLKAAKWMPSSVYMAFIDFKKHFDSVYHGAILESAVLAGLNERSVGYLASVFSSLTADVMGERVAI